MSKKTLNEANLAALGTDRLAQLLIEVSTGSAEIKRRLRLELAHNLGPEELARDVRKRLSSIRRSKSFVGWRKRKTLIKDLTTQSQMITDKIAPDAPTEAFDLLWEFIEMAPSVYARVDDSKGDVGTVFYDALGHFEHIAPRAVLPPIDLANRTWGALCDNRYDEFDGVIGLLSTALGQEGLDHLKSLVLTHNSKPTDPSEDHAALQFLRNLRSSEGNYVADQKTKFVRTCLQEIAKAQGDIHAYIAQFSEQDLAKPAVAIEVANLLLQDHQPDAALEALTAAPRSNCAYRDLAWDAAYVACLTQLGRTEDAHQHHWTVFLETLDAENLRAHLKAVPDFDDIEVEDAAKDHALGFDDVSIALHFILNWPDLEFASRLVQSRTQDLDGSQYDLMNAAADALRSRYPLAASLIWRAMIDWVLWDGHTARYAFAADHILDCNAADTKITDYGAFPSHTQYIEKLRSQYRHKSSFWDRLA